MPTVLNEAPAPAAPLYPPRKRWTRQEYAALEAAGLDLERVELVEGELIIKMPKNRPHVNSATLLHEYFLDAFGRRVVNAEAPIDVAPQDNPTSEPVPDLIVLRETLDHYQSNPRPADLRLVVEIADTSLEYDLTIKAALYARAGIAEYWVVDLAGRRLIVHREPQPDGRYGSITAYSEAESVSPLAAPQSQFRVSDAFPPRA